MIAVRYGWAGGTHQAERGPRGLPKGLCALELVVGGVDEVPKGQRGQVPGNQDGAVERLRAAFVGNRTKVHRGTVVVGPCSEKRSGKSGRRPV